MRHIEFKTVENDGTVKVVAMAKMVDGKVQLVASTARLKKTLMADPIIGYDHKEKTLEDGIDWLEALPLNYNGSRFFAEAVDIEEDSDLIPNSR